MSTTEEQEPVDIAVNTIEYSKHNNEPIAHLFGRDDIGNRWCVNVYGIKPFFYVNEEDAIPKNSRIIKVEKMSKQGWTTITDKYVKKITTKLPEDIIGDYDAKNGLRDRFKNTYEDDIPFETRIALELGIKSGIRVNNTEITYKEDLCKPIDFKANMRRLHVDIEVSTVETGNRVPNYERPINQMYSIACYDSYKEHFICFIQHPKYKNKKKFITKYKNPIPHYLKLKIIKKRKEIAKFITDKNKIIAEYEAEDDEDSELYDKIGAEEFYENKLHDTEKELEKLLIKNKRFKQLFKKEYKLSIWTFNNEKDMLKKFIDYYRYVNPDITTGWFFDQFDMPYMIERYKRLRLNIRSISPLNSVYIKDSTFRQRKIQVARVKGRIIFDTMKGYIKTLTTAAESTKLDNVGELILGIGKVKHSGIDEMWENNRNLLIKYNVQDVFIEMAIGVSQNVFDFIYDIKCYAGCSYGDVLQNSKVIDSYMLFKAKDYKYVLPSKKENMKKEKSDGATVVQGKIRGLQRWIVVLDLKSLYPMAMLTLNMGEDTVVVNPDLDQIPKLIKSSLKGVYFKKKISFLNSIIQELIDYRDDIRYKQAPALRKLGKLIEAELLERLEVAVKFITNSLFGVLGLGVFRLYNENIFANVTATGRLIIGFTIKVCGKLLYVVYYGDTDSVFVFLKSTNVKDAVKEAKELSDELNKSYEKTLKIYNIDKHYFKMKPEKIYKTIFLTRKKGTDQLAKKRYAGNIVWNDKKGECDYIDIAGFKRSDLSRLATIVMTSVIELACKDRVNSITPYLKNLIKEIKLNKYPLSDIAFSKGIGKPLSTYGNQDWIRAARWTNKYSGLWGSQTNFGAGSKPKFVYMKPKKLSAQYNKIEIVALDDDFFLPEHLVNAIDYDLLIDKTIGKKIETILEAIGLSWDRIISKFKHKGLGRKQ